MYIRNDTCPGAPLPSESNYSNYAYETGGYLQMTPTNSLRTGRARWILTGGLLLLTLASVVAALAELPPTYQSESSVVLLASPEASRPNGDNPYLSFSPSLTLTADVVSREMMAPSTVNDLASSGFPDSYNVALASYTTDTTGSVLLVTVTGPDKAAVEFTLHGVTNEISTVLAKLQASSPPADRILAATISMSGQPVLSLTQMARLLAVLIGVGLVASFGVPWLVEAQIAGRRIRRDTESATSPLPPDPDADGRWATAHHGGQHGGQHAR
jgi:hypothetical protein